MRRLGVPHLILTHLTDIARLLASCAGKTPDARSDAPPPDTRFLPENPRFFLSPNKPAVTPIASEPAYHTGLNTLYAAQLGNAPLGPGQVLGFLPRRLLERLARRRVARSQRLA